MHLFLQICSSTSHVVVLGIILDLSMKLNFRNGLKASASQGGQKTEELPVSSCNIYKSTHNPPPSSQHHLRPSLFVSMLDILSSPPIPPQLPSFILLPLFRLSCLSTVRICASQLSQIWWVTKQTDKA